MTSIATLLSYPINRRSRGTAHATFFFALTKVERIISYHHFEVQSPLLSSPCALVSVACLESPSARLTIPLWLDCGLMGRGQQPQGRFLSRKNRMKIHLTWILMGLILSVLFLYLHFFCIFRIFLWTSMANSCHKTWHRHLVQKSLREKDKFQMTCYFL